MTKKTDYHIVELFRSNNLPPKYFLWRTSGKRGLRGLLPRPEYMLYDTYEAAREAQIRKYLGDVA